MSLKQYNLSVTQNVDLKRLPSSADVANWIYSASGQPGFLVSIPRLGTYAIRGNFSPHLLAEEIFRQNDDVDHVLTTYVRGNNQDDLGAQLYTAERTPIQDYNVKAVSELR